MSTTPIQILHKYRCACGHASTSHRWRKTTVATRPEPCECRYCICTNHRPECRTADCGTMPSTHHGGYCVPCYSYRRKYGVDRSERIIVRHYDRTLERITCV